MPAERYFVEDPLQQGALVTLEEGEFRHLAGVMRAEVGDQVELVNGKGVLAQALVETLAKKSASLRVSERTVEPPEPYSVILAQAAPRSNRLDTILEKGTELGATHFWLFPGARSERKETSANQEQRMRSVLIAALKQCGRLYLPTIEIKPALAKWKDLPCKSFYGDVNPEAPALGAQQLGDSGCLFFIGPEAGFTEHEEQKLRDLGAQGVKLHKNILRTDTAAIVALTLLTTPR